MIFSLTYLCYLNYRMARKTFSAVKLVLAPNCSEYSTYVENRSVFLNGNYEHNSTDSNTYLVDESGWDPFNGDDCKTLLGTVDSSWAFAYALAIFVSGPIADRVNLRYFLTFGIIASGVGTGLLGIAYFANIHHISYFILVQVFNGAMQSTGTPGVIAMNGNWFGKQGRGFMLGIWNSNIFLGNIIGTSIAAIWAQPGKPWGWSFLVPGFISIAMGVVIFLFLIVDPSDVGLPSPQHNPINKATEDHSSGNMLSSIKEEKDLFEEHHAQQQALEEGKSKDAYRSGQQAFSQAISFRKFCVKSFCPCMHKVLIGTKQEGAIGIVGALKIPGVVEFALSYFFVKLIAYTFLFWLPFYVANTPIGGKQLSDKNANFLSTLFDVGGIIGGILAGLFSDFIKARGIVCALMLYLAIPILFFYRSYGGINISLSIVLMMLSGFLIGSPYCLIGTVVTNDLGTHKSLMNNQKAKATVSALIEGIGSMGVAIGPLLAGWILDNNTWDAVFYLLMVSCFLSSLTTFFLQRSEILTGSFL